MKLKKRLSRLKAPARSAKSHCELCGSFAPDGIQIFAGSDNPSVSVRSCQRCLRTLRSGTSLQKEALLLQFTEAQYASLAADLCKQAGFSPKASQDYLTRVKKDLPEILEQVTQALPESQKQGGES